MITKSIIYSIIITGFSFADVMFSMLNQNSIYFSYSYCFDNVDYINQDSESVSSKASYNNYEIGYVLNGKYDFNVKVIDNNSSVNDFDIPYKDVYKTIGFKYNLKNLEKIPINFKMGLEYTKSSNNLYVSNTIIFGLYKEINPGNYPVIPFLNILNLSYDYGLEEVISDSKIIFNCGASVKLTVDTEDNSVLKDVIWITTSINTDNFSQYYLGLSIGLYHPI